MIHKYHPSPSTFLTALQQRQQSLSTHSTQFTNTTFRYRRIDPESTQARSLKIQSHTPTRTMFNTVITRDSNSAILLISALSAGLVLGAATVPATSAAACYGSCPGRGQPYPGRGCKKIFGCPPSFATNTSRLYD
ncbi:hypothetical protein PSHT_02110 [Puccinia striiformis]|uniref:Uncharacterized protein n=1 Tax=Puccinia striiformis TaxID=27350 RepID=A0A2S4WIR9_9BASI|nr:hypothetical protein PSHT_02110 [Puccinia striiformis]